MYLALSAVTVMRISEPSDAWWRTFDSCGRPLARMVTSTDA
jgi:hypothetical protein